MDIIIPIITLIIGLAGGFAAGVWFLKRQMTNMTMDPKQMQTMAKQMGLNLNPKQMQQANRMMQNMNVKKGKK